MIVTKHKSRPLRVVHVTWSLDVGGLEKLLVEFARWADPARMQLHFLSLGQRGHLAEAIEQYGWPVVALDAAEGLRPGLVPRLAAQFRRWKADVVHTHDLKPLVYTAAASRLAQVPRWVHTWHGKIVRESAREKWLVRRLGAWPDVVVGVSQDAARILVNQGVPAARVKTIWNGIDTRLFGYTGPAADGPIVTVARLSPEKDVQNLIQAMSIIKEQGNGVHLEVGGYGVCLPELQQMTEQLGLNHQVRFLGKVDDVPAMLARARMFVLPSRTEGISLTLLEASARGLPIVATRVGGNPEVVADGVTGLLVPPQSPPDLAAAILRLTSDPETCQRMGYAGRERIEKHFDIRRMVSAYEDLYEQDLPRRTKTHAARAPHVACNIPAMPQQTQSLRCTYIPLEERGGTNWDRLRMCLNAYGNDALIIDQAPYTLSVLCALRMLWPFGFGSLISLDLVLSRPGSSIRERIKAGLKRLLFRQVDHFLMHLKNKRALKEVFGIAPHKLRYLPFKVNRLEVLEQYQGRTGTYVFTGGRSRRDYPTFCAAMSGLDYPGLILVPPPEVSSQHGTHLTGLQPPGNVKIVHDDGSLASWFEKLAGAKVVVFCISPETISPSGVSAYLMAMAMKKCVIISDSPATHDILEHEKTAILVPMRDAETLQQAIRKAWEDDDYRERIAEGGHRYVMSLGGEENLLQNVAREVLEILTQH
jgi:glycosyltransferase involved in cell wall biosynthesis